MKEIDVVEKTTEAERAVLTAAKFIHVTGLPLSPWVSGQTLVIGQNLPARLLGRYAQTPDQTMIITRGGEIWLSRGTNGVQAACIEQFCPRGNGAEISVIKGKLDSDHVFARLNDPDWTMPELTVSPSALRISSSTDEKKPEDKKGIRATRRGLASANKVLEK